MDKHAKGKVEALRLAAGHVGRLLGSSLAALVVITCAMSSPANAQLVVRRSVGVQAFETCVTQSRKLDDCVDAQTALGELFGADHALANVAVHTRNGERVVSQVIRMVRFDLNRQRHVIFLVQSNDFTESGKIAMGHPSGAYLSYIVFRHRAKWEVLTREIAHEKRGVWGRIDYIDASEKDMFRFYGLPNNKIMMAIWAGDMGQGFVSEWIDFHQIDLGVAVNRDTYRGQVPIASSDCSGLGVPEGPDMKGKYKIDASQNPPVITMVERYFKNCSNAPSGHRSVTKIYRVNKETGVYAHE
jgi:hypothetical protein